MTTAFRNDCAVFRPVLHIESHLCRVHRYHARFEAARYEGASAATIDLLGFIRDKLLAKNGTGVRVAITFDEFRRRHALLDIKPSETIEAWNQHDWEHASAS